MHYNLKFKAVGFSVPSGQEDEGSFGDSPFVLAGFGFIGGVGEVGDDVDQ